MGRILVLGNEQTRKWSENISNSHFIQMPVFSLGEDGERKLCEFVINNIDCDSRAIVVDVDEISKPELCLAFAMAIRLSILDIKLGALSPILFISRATQDILTGYKYSPIILTGSIAFDLPENAGDALEVMEPLSPSEYKTKFLDIIKILPNATEGRHSLANQWGASVLDKLMNKGTPSGNPILRSAEKSLYFKYEYVQTINVPDFLSGKQQTQYNMLNRPAINAQGKRILLIDDEADKGWEYVLKKLIITNEGDFSVIDHKAKDFNDFSKEEREDIANGGYDLIFLDLRMNGSEEENVYKPEDFSGMKILKQIKKAQKGVQVIMFTASNKAWNLKALLDEGADGYYIKESPEYKFSLGFSLANYDALRKNISDCLKRSYLREIDNQIKTIKKDFNKTHGDTTNFKNSIIRQLDLSFELLNAGRFEYAFITLYQIVELVNDQYLDRDDNNVWYIKDTDEDAKSWTTQNFKHECVASKFSEDDKRKFPEWKKLAALYYQLWKQEDKSFGYKIQSLINERNKFMHNEIDKKSIIQTESGYIQLFDVIKTICSFI